MIPIPADPKLLDALLSRVERIPIAGCWIYTGASNPEGYGRISIKCRLYYAHRLSYTLHKGPIPEGLVVCHRCDTPSCCNPEHLFAGTQSENLYDASRKERIKRIGGRPRWTHCKYGHEFTPANTVLSKTGSRACRTCRRARARVYESSRVRDRSCRAAA